MKEITDKLERILSAEKLNCDEVKNYHELKKDVLTALHKNDITANTSEELLAHIAMLYRLENVCT